jgi:tetratricopeptide (TPR) repeat protein
MDHLWQQINEAHHQRDSELVRQLIPKYLKAHRRSPESIYEASEFYRKLGDYADALRVLPKERTTIAVTKVPDIETKLELQQARLLNILGASNYALRLIGRIRAENRAKSKIEMVEIYQCNYKYAEVVELLGADYPVPDSEPWHQDWLLHFYLANALSGLKETKLAMERVEKIQRVSNSPLIKANALFYKGKYLVQAGEPEKALPVLLESLQFFQGKDQTVDHGILHSWIGTSFLKLGKYQEAENSLKIALNVFYQPAIKPEDWMEIVLLLEQIPGYKQASEQLAPRLWAQYGPDYLPLKRAGLSNSGKESDIFSISKLEGSGKRKHIDRGSDIYWHGNDARLGLDLTDELIWNLIYAGDYGLPQFRLYEILWPNELFSFTQHQKRLEQLVIRARAQGYKIEWKDLHLHLKSKDVSASSRPEKVVRGLAFLKEHSTFSRVDVETYFSISRASAILLCREWVKAGWANLERNSRYHVNIPCVSDLPWADKISRKMPK